MTSDINGTVVAIQGVAVESGTPDDGYVLTYVADDSQWEAKPIAKSGLTTEYFTADGYWICPEGVTSVLVVAAGGGGGGGSGASRDEIPGSGGGGSIQQASYIPVTFGTEYAITIGTGGIGGASVIAPGITDPTDGYNGTDGNSTYITNGATTVFYTIGGGGGGANGNLGTSFANNTWNNPNLVLPGFGGAGVGGATPSKNGSMNYIGGYLGGTAGSGFFAGSGGGAGPQGEGANGGIASTTAGTNASPGSNADDNTGAGGGGGGAYWAGTPIAYSGAGGNGGSGYLYIIY